MTPRQSVKRYRTCDGGSRGGRNSDDSSRDISNSGCSSCGGLNSGIVVGMVVVVVVVVVVAQLQDKILFSFGENRFFSAVHVSFR